LPNASVRTGFCSSIPGVATIVGEMETTRIPCGPSSAARLFVNASMPPFDAT
jgi:hypothetical protein